MSTDNFDPNNPSLPASPNLGTETKQNIAIHFLIYRTGGRNYFALLMGRLTAVNGQWTADVQVPGLGLFHTVAFGSGEGQCRTLTDTDINTAMTPFGFEPEFVPGLG